MHKNLHDGIETLGSGCCRVEQCWVEVYVPFTVAGRFQEALEAACDYVRQWYPQSRTASPHCDADVREAQGWIFRFAWEVDAE